CLLGLLIGWNNLIPAGATAGDLRQVLQGVFHSFHAACPQGQLQLGIMLSQRMRHVWRRHGELARLIDIPTSAQMAAHHTQLGIIDSWIVARSDLGASTAFTTFTALSSFATFSTRRGS